MTETFKQILVATDFSTCSAGALRFALRLGASLGASVDVVHVWDYKAVYSRAMASSGPPEREVVRMQESAIQRLKTFCEGLDVRRQLIYSGEAAAEVGEAAQNYDFLVVGTHGRQGVSRLFLGSVAEQIVRTAPCPVLTVRAVDPSRHTRPSEPATS